MMNPPTPPARFKTLADMQPGLDWLCRTDPRLKHATQTAGRFPKRLRPGGFAALLRAIIYQQISIHAATAIWARIEGRLGNPSATAVLAQGETGMAALGLSRPKARYAVALAQHVNDGALNFRTLPYMNDAEIHANLTAVPGIGPWTADIYLLAHLGRPDAFPAGDIALQEATRQLYGLAERPDAKAMLVHAERWAPYRAIAARVLWQFYSHQKSSGRPWSGPNGGA